MKVMKIGLYSQRVHRVRERGLDTMVSRNVAYGHDDVECSFSIRDGVGRRYSLNRYSSVLHSRRWNRNAMRIFTIAPNTEIDAIPVPDIEGDESAFCGTEGKCI